MVNRKLGFKHGSLAKGFPDGRCNGLILVYFLGMVWLHVGKQGIGVKYHWSAILNRPQSHTWIAGRAASSSYTFSVHRMRQRIQVGVTIHQLTDGQCNKHQAWDKNNTSAVLTYARLLLLPPPKSANITIHATVSPLRWVGGSG